MDARLKILFLGLLKWLLIHEAFCEVLLVKIQWEVIRRFYLKVLVENFPQNLSPLKFLQLCMLSYKRNQLLAKGHCCAPQGWAKSFESAADWFAR